MDKSGIFPTIVGHSIGLVEFIKTAFDPTNFTNIDQYIDSGKFNLVNDFRKVNLELAVGFEGETKKQAATRLVTEGCMLENTGELVQFLINNPSEVAKYSYVVALGEMSRWERPDGRIFVPSVKMSGINRYFYLEVFQTPFDFRDLFVGSNCRVLVSRVSR